MKKCSSCKIVQPFESFNKNKSRPDGYHNQCKTCRKQYCIDNDVNRKRWMDPVEQAKLNANHEAWQRKNREKYNSYMRNWNKLNKDYSNPRIIQYVSKRRATKKDAIPDWFDEDHSIKVTRMHELAAKLTSLTGERFEVDHIYPLKNDVCCGLHVWWNLQILPMVQNRSKGNKLPSENITSPRVSEDSFEEYLQSQFKIYADLYQIQDIEL